MTDTIADKLAALGLAIPEAPVPLANYVPYARSEALLVVSGQLPLLDGKIGWTGKLGAGVSIEEGQKATRQSFLNVLAQVNAACGGDLARVRRVIRLGGFIACTPDFTQHALVMNGASDLAVALFGEAGRHARTTIGVPSLPADAAVEVEGMFEID
jgi:enamine deaminase RidA (YjgF/YER057c/UK114 family)